MEFSQEWRSLWPISSTQTLPLLLQCPSSLGPLFFNPLPPTTTIHFTSPSLPLLPHSSLSLARFLQTSSCRDSSILPSVASATADSFDQAISNSQDAFLHNRLEPLRCPGNKLLVFFPTGQNLDRVGFVVLLVRDANLTLVSSFSSNLELSHRITRLSACPVNGCVIDGFSIVGFLMACTLYAVHWFAIKIGSDSGMPALMYLGYKLFKTCGVAHACWNPHLPKECLVLLQSGELFMFDMSLSPANYKFRGKKISVPWNESNEWFGCEFGWHPRILIVANSRALYKVDLRSGKCELSCLGMATESLNSKEVVGKDPFVAFSKADNDGFFYSVATEHSLLLFDIRMPLMPVLRWAHNLHEPRYMTALPLSTLRSNPKNEKYAGISDMGFTIMLGSFWSNDFSIFCYGRPPSGTIPAIATQIATFSDTIYAWELPSLLSVSGQSCRCSSCLLEEDFAKEDVPEWIAWQQKKGLVLGFVILDKKFSSFLDKPGEYGGFTLIRLTLSGKLESQQYCASWKLGTETRVHEETEKCRNDLPLCLMTDPPCKLIKQYSYHKFQNLYAHLNGNLAETLFLKFKKAPKIASEQKQPGVRFITFLNEKFRSFGYELPISNFSLSDIFRDVVKPTSLFEIARRVTWIKLSMDMPETTYPIYTEVHRAPIDQEMCPSLESDECSSKVQPSDDFVPLSAAFVIHGILKHGDSFEEKIDEFSPKKAFAIQHKSITLLAKETGVFCFSGDEGSKYAVLPMDDIEETLLASFNTNPFILHEESVCPDELSGVDIVEELGGFSQEGESFNLFAARFPENERHDKETNIDVSTFFDDLCPVEIKLSYPECEPEELRACELLKRQFLKWQDTFVPYGNLRERIKRQQQDVKPHGKAVCN